MTASPSPAADSPERFANPSAVCDIILKGGITSGVVYPLALTTLAEKYRFAQIGGTSAGAIAAAAAAAAEYGRLTGGDAGFRRIARVPQEIGTDLLKLFQPVPELKPLFNLLVAMLANGVLAKVFGIISAALRGCWISFLFGAAVGAVLVTGLHPHGGHLGFALRIAAVALTGGTIGIVIRLLGLVLVTLPRNDYGLCPGIRQPLSDHDAFTDWLGKLIDAAAGRGEAAVAPLTFGDLETPPGGRSAITLRMMTTSLMESRPYALPNLDNTFFFERSEWARLFPTRVMDYLLANCTRYTPAGGPASGEFYHFPDPAHLPLVVAARMSLSFPVLIRTVPLWRHDFTLHTKEDRDVLRRCQFSDGGLSSNFPIHFFDRALPRRPTFGITLDAYDKRRNWSGHTWLPQLAESGIQIPVMPFSGLTGFLGRLLDAAKDWQDNLQSTLPGYRERIVHVALEPDQGGLNLNMTKATIDTLAGYGHEAAGLLCNDFSLDDHRWTRFLGAMAQLEASFDAFATAYDEAAQGVDSYHDFLARFPQVAHHYKQPPDALAAMLKRADDLATLGRAWRAPPRIADGRIPKPDSEMQITRKL